VIDLLKDPMLWFLLAGMAAGQFPRLTNRYAPLFKLMEKHGLAWTIALLGFRVAPSQLIHPYLLVVVGVFIGFWFLSRKLAPLFGLKSEAGCLVSFGTTVCGATAVATAAPLLQKKSSLTSGEVGAAVATVNFLGAAGIVLVPLLANALDFNPLQGGVLAGGTLHAVGQALAAGFALGEEAGQWATLVKMSRVALLIPLLFYLNVLVQKKSVNESAAPLWHTAKNMWFIGAFVLLSGLQLAIDWPDALQKGAGSVEKFAFWVALFGMGTSIRLSDLWKNGAAIVGFGALLFALNLALWVAVLVWIPA
jgi:uncharacterized integral membrane protein (TIGR00698 family)